MPGATGIKTTWLVVSHIPIIFPSGEQTSCPGDVQEVVLGTVAVDTEVLSGPVAGAAEAVDEPVGTAVGMSLARMVATAEAAVEVEVCMVAPWLKIPPMLG